MSRSRLLRFLTDWLGFERNEEQGDARTLRERVRELEKLLSLQDRKVKHLSAFAEQMQESEAGTRAIIDNALDGIITIDHLGRVMEFNPAAERLFGYEREEILGKPLVDLLVPPRLRESQRRGWEQFLSSGYGPWIGHRVETVGLRIDGREFPIELAITVLHPQQPPMLTAYVRDLSQLKQTAEKLSQSNGRLQAVLDAATQAAIIATDANGRITLFNRGAERMLGYKADEVADDHTPVLFLKESELAAHVQQLTEEFCIPIEGFAALVERARRSDHEEREWTFVRKDGSHLTVNLAVTAIRDDGVEISGYLAVATDVTSRQRARLALERAKEAAEIANRAKSDFLANVSHEIRTPMNGILGMTQLALDTDLTTEQREYLQMVKSSADGLLTVINDILDFSKIEAGRLELDPIAFELRDVLADAVRSLSLRASLKNLELACHVPATVPDYVIGDPIRLRQVLLNLVGNAIKFTEQGEVIVRVQLADNGVQRKINPAVGDQASTSSTTSLAPVFQPGGDIKLHVSVSDTGIGISPEKLPYIFDAFVQEDTSTTRKYGGTGLGLTITSRLVEMMGGELWAESKPGEGSTFHFTLRLKLQDRSPSRLLPRRPADLQGMTVLVVDDNATHQRILADILSTWLMKPTTVNNARQALEQLEAAAEAAKPFSLVLLDAHMPDEDGVALAATIRLRSDLGDPQLILLSSPNRPDDGEKCRDLGIRQRLTKPIKPSDLLHAILKTLGSSNPSASGQARSAPTAQEPSSGKLVEAEPAPASIRGLRLLLAEDNLVNQRLMLAVLEKENHDVTLVANGSAAVRAVQQERFDLVLMDVQMPEMNGLEATRAIRAWEQEFGGHVPIIAMTAHAMKGAREDCLRAGMDEYLSKPVQIPELLRVMAAWTRKSTEQSATSESVRAKAFDSRPLMQRLSDDEDLMRELIRLFQEDGPRMLGTICGALEAGDAESVEQTAHLLKGSAGNFAAAEVVQAAQHLENLGRSRDLGEAQTAYSALERALSRFSAALDEWLVSNPA